MNWNKHFFRLLKTVFTSYPYDYCYLLEIEAAKIREMAEHFKKVNSGEKIGFAYEGMEKDVWYMELAVKLIDIMVHDENLFHYDFDKATKDNKNGYACDVYVNTKNIDRYIDSKTNKEYILEHPHELYLAKARKLYYKIRYEQDFYWWE